MVLVFDTEGMVGVLADACLYEWRDENGKTLVQVYAEAHPAVAGTDERFLLDAFLDSKYRIIESKEIVPGAGLRGRDILNDEDVLMMDILIGQSQHLSNVALATRTIPLGDYCMSDGAPLPLIANDRPLGYWKGMQDEGKPASLSIIRACLVAGAGEHIRYGGAETTAKRREPKHQWRRR